MNRCRSAVAWDATVSPKCARDIDTVSEINARGAKARRENKVMLVIAALVIAAFFLFKSDNPPPNPGAATASNANLNTSANCDLQCAGDHALSHAGYACKHEIERLAKNNFEWTDGFLGEKFRRFRWLDQDRRTLTYIGDKIKFQNGFGAWIIMTYECDYDPATGKAIDVRAYAGQLPK